MSDSPQLSLSLPTPDRVEPVLAASPIAPLAPQAQPLALTFSGSGGEYFRIWIVNLLLTIVTAGIYSAWAKVRRLQYFARNTELDGAAFDFHGNAFAILKGRLLALVLLAGYQFAFGLSMTVGVAVFTALVLVLPWLLRGALRFRLYNTSWRGLRFGFTGSVIGAYAVFVPPILMFLFPGVLGALITHQGPQAMQSASGLFGLIGLLYLLWPSMHAMIKRYQHAHLQYGGMASTYTLETGDFWPPYLIMFGILFGLGILGAALSAVLIHMMGKGAGMAAVFAVIACIYIAMLGAMPFLQARIGNLVWSHTAFPGVAIRSDMTFRGLFGLHAVNVIATLLTAGLFHPFAMVRTHRYLLAHLHLSATADLDQLIDESARRNVNAAGDGAADFLGVDFAL